MKKVVKIFFLILVISVNAEAQPVTWSKWYDYNNMDSDGSDVIQTFDGGYLVLGDNYMPSNNSAILIKTDPYGAVEWQRVIDQTVTQGDQIILYAVHQANDSGFILSGQSYSDSAVLIKTSKLGNIVYKG